MAGVVQSLGHDRVRGVDAGAVDDAEDRVRGIPALFSIRSIRDVPGFFGNPDVLAFAGDGA